MSQNNFEQTNLIVNGNRLTYPKSFVFLIQRTVEHRFSDEVLFRLIIVIRGRKRKELRLQSEGGVGNERAE